MMQYITIILFLINSFQHLNKAPIIHDYEEGIELDVELDKPVFLFFTGIFCKNTNTWNEIIHEAKVMRQIQEKYVPIVLDVDDSTKLPKVKTVIHNGQVLKIRTKGQEWSFLELTKFKINVAPLMAILDIDETQIKPPIFGHISREELLKYIE